MTERLDAVIFGATGITGKNTAKKFHNITKNDPSIKWGIAGRSESKLRKVIQEIEEKTGDKLSHVNIIIADVNNSDSLKQMTKQTKLIINCCGPYDLLAEGVIKACIETKTHHIDVSGEATYIEEMQLKYDEEARKAGIYIISSCAYDSIPSDLGIVFLEKNFPGQLNSAEVYMYNYVNYKFSMMGSAIIHYGTWESIIRDYAQHKKYTSIHRELYPEDIPQMYPALKSRGLLHKSEVIDRWSLPLVGPDPSVVYRTQRYFYEHENKRPIQMKGYMSSLSFPVVLFTLLLGYILDFLLKFKYGVELLLNYPKLFTLGMISHKGPTEEVMNNTFFTFTIHGKGWDRSEKDFDGKPTTKTMNIKVSGKNPAYGATCSAVVCSGITILKEADKMPKGGGVYTPGVAFVNTSLIDLLNKNDFSFEVLN